MNIFTLVGYQAKLAVEFRTLFAVNTIILECFFPFFLSRCIF